LINDSLFTVLFLFCVTEKLAASDVVTQVVLKFLGKFQGEGGGSS